MSLQDYVPYAQIGSTLFAFGGLIFAATQIRYARRASDLKALQDFFETVTKAERHLNDQTEARPRQRAFADLMNTFELYARAYNEKLFNKSTRSIVHDKLVDLLGILDDNDEWKVDLESFIQSPTTFSELQKFMKRNRSEIKSRAEIERRRYREDGDDR